MRGKGFAAAVLAGGAMLALATQPVRAEKAPLGRWLTAGGKSQVEIAPCGDRLGGRIVWLKEPLDEDGKPKRDVKNKDESLRQRPILGLPLLQGFKRLEDGSWGEGSIYNPEDGDTYRSQMRLVGDDELQVEGCVFIFCKAQTWKKVKP